MTTFIIIHHLLVIVNPLSFSSSLSCHIRHLVIVNHHFIISVIIIISSTSFSGLGIIICFKIHLPCYHHPTITCRLVCIVNHQIIISVIIITRGKKYSWKEFFCWGLVKKIMPQQLIFFTRSTIRQCTRQTVIVVIPHDYLHHFQHYDPSHNLLYAALFSQCKVYRCWKGIWGKKS